MCGSNQYDTQGKQSDAGLIHGLGYSVSEFSVPERGKHSNNIYLLPGLGSSTIDECCFADCQCIAEDSTTITDGCAALAAAFHMLLCVAQDFMELETQRTEDILNFLSFKLFYHYTSWTMGSCWMC